MANYYTLEIDRLEKKGADLRGNKDKNGTTFYKLSDGITANEKVIADYRQRLQELERQTAGKNEQLTTVYLEEVKVTAWTLVWITLLMELLFECCIAYIWYYYYRSYVERKKVGSVDTVGNPRSSDLAALQKTIQLLQAENEALRTQHAIPESPSPSHNGTNIENRTLIGFKSGHTRTGVDTPPKMIIDDRYTVPHTYTRAGQTVTVHYNATMVRSRVGEYERKIMEAKQKGMVESVIENRKKWLQYWKEKEVELVQKTREAVV